MASPSPAPAPSSASHRRRSRPPSPTASSVGSSPAFPPRKRRRYGRPPPRSSPAFPPRIRRRYGRPPPFLGLACYDDFYPGYIPGIKEFLPCLPLYGYRLDKRALAVARKADFEYDFVPRVPKKACGWFPLDARDGRVLIQSKQYKYFPNWWSSEYRDGDDFIRPRFMNYAVCDPLFKRYVLLPPIPDDLTVNEGSLVNFGLCLAPSQEDEADTSFRVICVARYETKLVVFVFSSVTRQWGIATSSNWTMGTEEPPKFRFRAPKFYGLGLFDLGLFDYVDGCFYWTVPWADKILMLDALKMELSVINYAHRVEGGFRACIAVDREGTPGMLTVGEYLGNREFRLSRIAKQSDHESPNERLLENIIKLPSYHNEYFTLGAAEGFIFLRGIPKGERDDNWHPGDDNWHPEDYHYYYSLNVKTAEFEMVCAMARDNEYDSVCPYFRFPPPSAKPCV